MGMKKLLLVFAILSLSLAQFSSLVYAQDFTETFSEGTEWFLGEALGFPDDWLTVNGFIYKFFIPFIGVWAIILGFLRVIKIFETEDKLEYIISFAMAFSTIPLKWFVPFVQWVFGIGGAYATIIFLALFVFGTTVYAWVKGVGWWGLGRGRGGEFRTGKRLTIDIARLGHREQVLRKKIELEEAKGDDKREKQIAKWQVEADELKSKITSLEALRTRRAGGQP